MNPMIQKTASFLRWRLVPIRYLGRLRRLNRHNFNSTYLPKSTKAQEIERVGFTSGPVVEGELLRQLQSIYLPRVDAVKNTKSKAPFVNLSRPEDMGRVAIFATFSSDKPFAPAMPLITENTKKILEVVIELRPDLDRRVL